MFVLDFVLAACPIYNATLGRVMTFFRLLERIRLVSASRQPEAEIRSFLSIAFQVIS